MLRAMKKYEELFAQLHSELIPYYRSWCHDYPMVISTQRNQELKRMQKVLYRCIDYYVQHYQDYLDEIPFDEKVLAILKASERYPFEAGTFRPDYLLCEDGNLKICEITSRFFGNGYFLSYFMEHAGAAFAVEAGIMDYHSYFEELLEYLADMLGDKKKLCVLKSADKSDSIRLYVPFYQALGAEVTILEADEVENKIELLKDSFVVSALNQTDIMSLSMETIERIIDSRCRNDFRTVFLLHDKRFFKLFHIERFTEKCLSPEDIIFLQEHTVPTYTIGMDREVFADARKHKDLYIIKHARLGKSEKVYAGCLCADDAWERIFASDELQNMILQPFIKQKIYPIIWNGQKLNDYVAGTILCVDNHYFGTGLFRTSTRPVINQTDAHKVAPVITDETWKFEYCHCL